MPPSHEIDPLQKLITNRLDVSIIGEKSLAGIIGDGPSKYSKSPALWNAAFRRLGMNAIYLPFDVQDAQVGPLFQALRSLPRFIGINVTVPHKVRVIDFLDAIDTDAERIGAVNTVVKNRDDKLIGYNTDGAGFIDSMLLAAPDEAAPFIDSLDGMDILLLGAGGSARAVAFHLSDHIGRGTLIIANRTRRHADELAAEITKLGRNAVSIDESAIGNWAAKAGLIVNSTTKGQGGVRKLDGGKATILVPYSAIAPANPPLLTDDGSTDLEQRWYEIARQDIESNKHVSLDLARTIPKTTRFYDLIYHPAETTFLRHARETGHRTMNGKNMIVRQAVLAFCNHICLRQLTRLGKNDDATFDLVTTVMYSAW